MKRIFLNIAIIIMFAAGAKAQVTIGSLEKPQDFSLLELEGNGTRGLRLPQLDTEQRKALDFSGHETEALGLQIFNIFTRCVETWNGTEWIQQCDGEPLDPQTTGVCTTCEVSTANNLTFTAKADPAATGYEFFIDNASHGYQISNSITFAASPAGTVGVKYYYRSSFLKPAMIPVPGNGGQTWYHSTSSTGGDGTSTTVAIPDLNMSETPITQAQFDAVFPDRITFTTANGDNYFRCGKEEASSVTTRPTSALPADNINWYAAIAYCNKLSAMEGKELCYSVTVSGQEVDWKNLTYAGIPGNSINNAEWDAATCNFAKNGYRLPTSSEWEYAARGGTTNLHPMFSGSYYRGAYNSSEASDSLCLVAWWSNNNNVSNTCSGDSQVNGTKDVKTKRANVFGLYDMTGNIYEWCWGWSDENNSVYPIATPTADSYVASASSTSSVRVLRGGGWGNSANGCRVSYRNSGSPFNRDYYCGFRVVCR
ncbi:MAG: formylglycine-generating enzyme family protein [Dysgonamonadaceae bacterium]|jgi:formylglycine-generating enzyme required for sulfatase activity|nr:formylglycine-generating enzyme family protein [Dysgonamonadaceae bacterium]